MHELGVTKYIAEAVIEAAEKQGAQKVTAVRLLVGDMRNLEEEWVGRYFRRCAKDTVAADARIYIKYVPISFYCRDCGSTFTLDVHKNQRMNCPECGSNDFTMVTGKELTISAIEIE